MCTVIIIHYFVPSIIIIPLSLCSKEYVFATVYKAKGLEFDTVHLLDFSTQELEMALKRGILICGSCIMTVKHN